MKKNCGSKRRVTNESISAEASKKVAEYLADCEALDEVDVSSKKYPANTVGALIDVLKRYCDMNDILLPRVNKQEHFIFNVQSDNGKCVIDLVKGSI